MILMDEFNAQLGSDNSRLESIVDRQEIGKMSRKGNWTTFFVRTKILSSAAPQTNRVSPENEIKKFSNE